MANPDTRAVVANAILSLCCVRPGEGASHSTKDCARTGAPIDLHRILDFHRSAGLVVSHAEPPKGDYGGVPLNKAARQIADAWDPAKDEANGTQCKSYGAAAPMRIPQKLHITGADDNTLRIDAEAGSQTRLLHFGASTISNAAVFNKEAAWQGDSAAEWEITRQRRPPLPEQNASAGSLKVVTTHMRPGYLRRNGVPYGEKAVMTEHFDVTSEPNGWRFILLTTQIDDPKYLTSIFLLNTPFRLLPDGAQWNPGPCTAR